MEAGQGGGLLEGGQGGAPRGAHAGAGTRIPGRCYRLDHTQVKWKISNIYNSHLSVYLSLPFYISVIMYKFSSHGTNMHSTLIIHMQFPNQYKINTKINNSTHK